MSLEKLVNGDFLYPQYFTKFNNLVDAVTGNTPSTSTTTNNLVELDYSELLNLISTSGLSVSNTYIIQNTGYLGKLYIKPISTFELNPYGVWKKYTSLKPFGIITCTGQTVGATINEININGVNILSQQIFPDNLTVTEIANEIATSINDSIDINYRAIACDNSVVIESYISSSSLNDTEIEINSVEFYPIVKDLKYGEDNKEITLYVELYIDNNEIKFSKCFDYRNNTLIYSNNTGINSSLLENYRFGDERFYSGLNGNIIMESNDNLPLDDFFIYGDNIHFYNVKILNDSYFKNTLLVNPTFANVELLNASYVEYISLYGDTSINGFKLENESYINNIGVKNSNINDVKLNNQSYIYDIKSVTYFSLTNVNFDGQSYLDTIDGNFTFDDIDFNDGSFYDISTTPTTSFRFSNIKSVGSYISNISNSGTNNFISDLYLVKCGFEYITFNNNNNKITNIDIITTNYPYNNLFTTVIFNSTGCYIKNMKLIGEYCYFGDTYFNNINNYIEYCDIVNKNTEMSDFIFDGTGNYVRNINNNSVSGYLRSFYFNNNNSYVKNITLNGEDTGITNINFNTDNTYIKNINLDSKNNELGNIVLNNVYSAMENISLIGNIFSYDQKFLLEGLAVNEICYGSNLFNKAIINECYTFSPVLTAVADSLDISVGIENISDNCILPDTFYNDLGNTIYKSTPNYLIKNNNPNNKVILTIKNDDVGIGILRVVFKGIIFE